MEPVLLAGWGRTAPTGARLHTVEDDTAVGKVLDQPAPRGVLARGLGRSYGDAAQNAGGDVIDMTTLSGVRSLDLERGTATVAAGVSLDALLLTLLPLGWFVAVTPGTRFVTVGGAIASDIHGKNHHGEGSFANHVLSMTLRLPGGDSVTLSPKHDPDAFWATAGGMGLTGVVTEATLALLPVETSRMRVDTVRTRDLDECMDLMERGDDAHRYSVAWVDLLARGASMGRSVLTQGDHARMDELPAGTPPAVARAYAPASRLSAPPWMPAGLLRRTTVGAFNELWFRKAPKRQLGAIHSISSFFHPLDFVHGWNRVYGRPGFLQHQIVVPFGAEAVLRHAMEQLSEARVPSFVTVLKRFGAGNGWLSFPVPGWTLALDAPAPVRGLGPLLDRIDRQVAEAGGRVYLAKDSRLDPALLATMYPELDRWRAVAERLDPEHVLRSDLDRRLGLRG